MYLHPCHVSNLSTPVTSQVDAKSVTVTVERSREALRALTQRISAPPQPRLEQQVHVIFGLQVQDLQSDTQQAQPGKSQGKSQLTGMEVAKAR